MGWNVQRGDFHACELDERLEFSSPKQAMPLLPIHHRLFRSLFNSGLNIASGSE
jgi:hypothetical protein